MGLAENMERASRLAKMAALVVVGVIIGLSLTIPDQLDVMERLGNANYQVALSKIEKTSLLEEIEQAGEDKQKLLDIIATLESKPSEVKYIVRTQTKLVPEERVVTVRDLPPSYTHTYSWNNGLEIAEFSSDNGEYSFTTHDLVLKGTMVVGDKDAGLYLEGSTSAEPDKWVQLPVDLDVKMTQVAHKVIEPNIGLGLVASYPDPALHPSVFVSIIHPTKSFDLATIRVGTDGRTASAGLDIVSYNVGEPLPILTDVWVGAGPGINTDGTIQGAVTISSKF